MKYENAGVTNVPQCDVLFEIYTLEQAREDMSI